MLCAILPLTHCFPLLQAHRPELNMRVYYLSENSSAAAIHAHRIFTKLNTMDDHPLSNSIINAKFVFSSKVLIDVLLLNKKVWMKYQLGGMMLLLMSPILVKMRAHIHIHICYGVLTISSISKYSICGKP